MNTGATSLTPSVAPQKTFRKLPFQIWISMGVLSILISTNNLIYLKLAVMMTLNPICNHIFSLSAYLLCTVYLLQCYLLMPLCGEWVVRKNHCGYKKAVLLWTGRKKIWMRMEWEETEDDICSQMWFVVWKYEMLLKSGTPQITDIIVAIRIDFFLWYFLIFATIFIRWWIHDNFTLSNNKKGFLFYFLK